MRRSDGPPLLVVGDCLLDVDLEGRASRLCPDEPAPVLENVEEAIRPGGAGLAALLCSALRPTVLVTAFGSDPAGQRLRELLEAHVTVVNVGAPHTVSKTRIRTAGRTLARLDEVHRGQAPGDSLDPGLFEQAAAILVSDYGLGLTSRPEVRGLLRSERPTVWDPHPRGSAPLPGMTAVTPNEAEARRFAGTGSAADQGRVLLNRWRAQCVAVTCGADGAVVVMPSGNATRIPAPSINASDTCGAGDAFAARLTSALADELDIHQAVQVAVTGSADYLRRGGVSGLARADRPASTGNARAVVAEVRARGGRVVMAGGCFDLLHAGHVSYLQAARALGDCLVVALNSDDSVRALKGPGRPVVTQHDRQRVLQALECVDAVVIFSEATPQRLISEFQPDVFAKGGDYHQGSIPEANVVRANGGDVVVLPSLAGRSSTALVAAAHRAHIEEEPCRTQPA